MGRDRDWRAKSASLQRNDGIECRLPDAETVFKIRLTVSRSRPVSLCCRMLYGADDTRPVEGVHLPRVNTTNKRSSSLDMADADRGLR
jgi:hypothetical protein